MYRHYFLPSFEEQGFFCFPHSAGHYAAPLDHQVSRPNGVRDFSLHLVTDGEGCIDIGGTTYLLKRGDLFFHAPWQPMQYRTSDTERWNIYWLQFNGSGLASFLLEKGLHGTSVWHTPSPSRLQEEWTELLDELDQTPEIRPAKISTLTYAILTSFVSDAVPFTQKRGLASSERLIQLLPLMRQQAHLPFELEKWAAQLALTPNYFCSLFKKVTRLTPVSYITKCRIQHSKHLLLERPDMAIKEVAICSGYANISYYNKLFMQSEGMTPGDFRQIYLKSH